MKKANIFKKAASKVTNSIQERKEEKELNKQLRNIIGDDLAVMLLVTYK